MRILAALALGLTLHACGGSSTTPVAEGVADDIFPGAWSLDERIQPTEAAGGMVVSGHPLASRVGADILADGGNAVDAAVAVGFALTAVLPEAGNIGGGGFLVYRDDEGVHALDYREKAPGGADHDMYLDAEGNLTEASRIGHLASGVPGSVAGLAEMHARFGSMPWDALVEPAVELALGHAIDEGAPRQPDVRYPGSESLRDLGGAVPRRRPGAAGRASLVAARSSPRP